MRKMKGNGKAGYLWKWVRPPLRKVLKMSLAVPLRFYAPVALEVNFSSGSTFGFVLSVGGSEKTVSSSHQFSNSIVSSEAQTSLKSCLNLTRQAEHKMDLFHHFELFSLSMTQIFNDDKM